MSGFSDDRWRDSYDAWKLASPYDDDPYYEEDCDHGDFDVDHLGEAHCNRCSERWMLTNEQLERYDRLQADLQRKWERNGRRERSPFRRAWRWLRSLFESRQTDDIPF